MNQRIRENTEEQAAVFAVLSDPTRLELVKLLLHQQGSRALCVNALASLLSVTQSAVSQHLRILKSIGLGNRHLLWRDFLNETKKRYPNNWHSGICPFLNSLFCIGI